MISSRRSFMLATALCAVVPLALAGCNETPPQIAATLANAQAEASAIFTAVKSFVPVNAASTITTGLSAAQTAITAFLAIQPGQSGVQAAEAVLNGLTPLLSLLPIAGTTLADIKLGLSLVEAFAGGIAAVAAPAPSAAVGAAPMNVIQAPIPIRISLA